MGAVAGYFGGVLDAIMMRIVDAGLSIPVLFLLIVLATIIRPAKVTSYRDKMDVRWPFPITVCTCTPDEGCKYTRSFA